jgi:hypothetical protein
VRRRGQLESFAFDPGTGVEAMDAGEVLLGAGFSFRWQADRHPLNRNGSARGIPVEGY